MQTMSPLEVGMYDLREAARLTGLHPTRVRNWFTSSPKAPGRGQLFTPDTAPVQGAQLLSFLDLIDLYVCGRLRCGGVSMRAIRNVYQRLQHDLRQKHPFAHARLAAEGADLLLNAAEARDREELIEALTDRKLFAKSISPFLKRLEYDPEAHLARRWRIADGVSLYPGYSHGHPVVDSKFVLTEVLADAYHADKKDARRVAIAYGVTPADVLAAVRFEAGLRA